MRRIPKIAVKTDLFFNPNNIKKYLFNEITKNDYIVNKNIKNLPINNKIENNINENKNQIDKNINKNQIDKNINKNQIDENIDNNINENKNLYVKFGNVYVLITGYFEYTLMYIINKSMSIAKKNNEGLYIIDNNLLENIIIKDNDLKNNFAMYLSNFDPDINYIANLFPTKIINNYLSEKISTNIKIIENGVNLLSYLLLKTINILIKNAYLIITYYNKSRITFKSILFSFKILYSGNFLNTIFIKLEHLTQLINEKDEKINDNNDKLINEKDENNINIDNNIFIDDKYNEYVTNLITK